MGRLLAKQFSPKDLQGLSLWLKADAGITFVSSYVAGIIDNGYSFDGATSLQPLNGAGSEFAFGTNDFSVSFWVYPTSAPNNNQVIINWAIWPNTSGFVVNYGEENFGFFLGGFEEAFNYYPPTMFNVWHHVVIVRTSGTANFYVNGISRGTANWNYDFTDGLWYIGRAQDVEGYFLNGTLDEMGVWNRALSGAEVTALYNSGAGIAYPFASQPSLLSNISAYWNFNDTLNDQTANAKNLTLEIGSERVASWADQSENGNNATPVANNPIYNVSDLNSKPTISLTSMSDNVERVFSISINPLGAAGSTAFSVQYVEDVCNDGNDNGPIFGNFGGSEDSASLTQTHYPYGPDCFVYDAFGTRLRKDQITSPVTIANAWTLYSVKSTNNDWQSFVNGQLMYSDPTNTYSNTIGGDDATLYIGKQTANGTFQLKGKVAEVIVYNRVLTTIERQKVEAYLNAKYAIYSPIKNTKILIKKQNLGGGKITIKRNNLFTCPFNINPITCPSVGFSDSGWGLGPNLYLIGTTTAPDNSNSAIIYESLDSTDSYVSQGFFKYWAPYTRYEFSIWTKLIAGEAAEGNIMNITRNGGSDRVVLSAIGNLTSEWQKFTITFTTGGSVSSYVTAFFAENFQGGTRIAVWGAEMYINK